MSIVFHREWIRMSRYELTEQKNELSISSAPSAEREIYNPFEHSQQLLLSFLHIGFLAHKGEEVADAIVSFVHTYGMLGFAQSIIQKEYEDGSVKVYKPNFVTPKPALTLEEYVQLIMPECESPRRFYKDQKGMAVTDMMALKHRSENWLCMIDSWYSESLQWISDFAVHLYQLLKKAQCGEAFSYGLGNVRTAVQSDGGVPKMEYAFDSLKSVLDILLISQLLNPRRTIRLCRHCGGPFESENLKTAYCSPSCRNVHNVKLSRSRRRQ